MNHGDMYETNDGAVILIVDPASEAAQEYVVGIVALNYGPRLAVAN